ncbi:hypothetical protein MUK42_10986 [Musa troglodytarum]|uniref:AP2/ERF domain-containing protein n=1 Tax=Musa troglodytarum TaxID=320322 RepID=A0A9E7KDK3_9LILI|nr:hypothetical protein MUK42_10986 [Musa troglodytarum]
MVSRKGEKLRRKGKEGGEGKGTMVSAKGRSCDKGGKGEKGGEGRGRMVSGKEGSYDRQGKYAGGGMALILCQRLLLGGESIIASLTVPLMVKSEFENLRQSDQNARTKSRHSPLVGTFPTVVEAALAYDDAAKAMYGTSARINLPGAVMRDSNEVHSDRMNVSGSRESIIEFPTVELEDEGRRNEEPSVVADACNVELYQYVPEGEFSIEDMQRIMDVDIENRNELTVR